MLWSNWNAGEIAETVAALHSGAAFGARPVADVMAAAASHRATDLPVAPASCDVTQASSRCHDCTGSADVISGQDMTQLSSVCIDHQHIVYDVDNSERRQDFRGSEADRQLLLLLSHPASVSDAVTTYLPAIDRPRPVDNIFASQHPSPHHQCYHHYREYADHLASFQASLSSTSSSDDAKQQFSASSMYDYSTSYHQQQQQQISMPNEPTLWRTTPFTDHVTGYSSTETLLCQNPSTVSLVEPSAFRGGDGRGDAEGAECGSLSALLQLSPAIVSDHHQQHINVGGGGGGTLESLDSERSAVAISELNGDCSQQQHADTRLTSAGLMDTSLMPFYDVATRPSSCYSDDHVSTWSSGGGTVTLLSSFVGALADCQGASSAVFFVIIAVTRANHCIAKKADFLSLSLRFCLLLPVILSCFPARRLSL